mmetsp:Transcript_51216/g.116421  ORF Transcript_51216/g.116421 Transcript_51216/m.116421 type:complete len:343 (+) Transcript_51216:111-1139(+)
MTNKSVVILALFAGLQLAGASFYTENEAVLKYHWDTFKEEHSRFFDDEKEESRRFEIFKSNLKLIDERNFKEGGRATHGITKFADMAPDEFKEIYLNLDYEKKTLDPSKPHPGKGIKPLKPGQEAVADWTGNYTTPIKDQGVCGSCWAFSVTEQIESDWMRSGGEMLILSAQQVCSCTSYLLKPIVGGCRGGKPEKGFEYAEKPGLELDADYPYTSGRFGKTGDCSADKGKAVVKTSGFTNVAAGQKGAEELMAAYVGGTGPLSIVVDASEWSTYTGGVVSSCGEDVDHAVQVVGVDTVQGFWKVRNTWGTSWGESGFIRLAFGNNTCAITTDANYATVLSA